MRMPELRELLPIGYAAGSACVAVMLLKTLPMGRFLLLLDRRVLSLPKHEPALYGRIAIAVTRRVPRLGVGECLLRSILLYRMLRAAGYLPSLVIGVSRDGGTLRSHGWIELADEPLCEPEDPRIRYQTTLRHEAEQSHYLTAL